MIQNILNNRKGFSLLELMVVLALVGILVVGRGISDIKEVHNPLISSAETLAATLKQARSQALSQTNAVTLYPTSVNTLRARYGDSCSAATQVVDPKISLDLPKGVELQSTAWNICFNSRGFANSNIEIDLENNDSEIETVEVFLGGGIMVQ